LWCPGLVVPQHLGSSQSVLEPVSPALAGRFFTTEPPRKPPSAFYNDLSFLFKNENLVSKITLGNQEFSGCFYQNILFFFGSLPSFCALGSDPIWKWPMSIIQRSLPSQYPHRKVSDCQGNCVQLGSGPKILFKIWGRCSYLPPTSPTLHLNPFLVWFSFSTIDINIWAHFIYKTDFPTGKFWHWFI